MLVTDEANGMQTSGSAQVILSQVSPGNLIIVKRNDGSAGITRESINEERAADEMKNRANATKQQRVTIDMVLRQLRRHDFAVLSTVSDEGTPDAAGVNYGVSRPSHDLAIYVMTRKHLKKARNISQNPSVTLVVPLARHFLWFLPPPTIQVRGRAEILDWTDEEGTAVFQRFWMGRRILAAYQASHRRGETRICFLKITPEPVIATYMVGSRAWELTKRMESGAAKVVIPPESLSTSQIAPAGVAPAPSY